MTTASSDAEANTDASRWQAEQRWQASADVVVVGSGVAGLTTALEAAAIGLNTLVVTKASIESSNTRWAQGGIAVVLADQAAPPGETPDSIERHVRDTLDAGGELCDPEATRSIIADGPRAVRALLNRGARFDIADGPNGSETGQAYPGVTDRMLARTREGGHSAYRVVHAGGDATGAEVERALADAARAGARDGHGGLTVLEHHLALELHRDERGIRGLTVLAPDGSAGLLVAPAVVLATGGLGQLYHATTNPEVATADGIALALRAGATVADLEFVQFHPTVLFTGMATPGRRPLVTEAVRGEGAVLVDGAGQRIMTGVHPAEDLAPRDVVSAAITQRLRDNPGGVGDRVFLDATHLSAEKFADRFPTVHAACLGAGIDPAVQPIPVAPAAHFGCGGVLTDSSGRTEIAGLYAVGEVARTGLHGANRLASNSLLEGLVTGTRAAHAAAKDRDRAAVRPRDQRSWAVDLMGRAAPREVAVGCDRGALQGLMSRHAGIGRDAEGLAAVAAMAARSHRDPRRIGSRIEAEDAALGLAAGAVAAAAAERAESRGCHVRTDYPAPDPGWRRSVLVRLDESGTPTVHGSFETEGPEHAGRVPIEARNGERA